MITDPSPKREFPFPMHMELPLYETPYFEMYFALEVNSFGKKNYWFHTKINLKKRILIAFRS